MPINCSNCRAYCCRVIGKLDPSLDRGDCVCKYLNEETCKCSIYDKRPLICNTDLMYDKLFKGLIPREQYDALNAASCEQLRTMHDDHSNYNSKGE